jgi:hypothetical protein
MISLTWGLLSRRLLLLFFISLALGSPLVILDAQESRTPMMFQLNWGSSFNTVQSRIRQSDVGLGTLYHYQIYPGRGELDDLKSSSYVKYSSEGAPFFSIPAEAIFTFYNPENDKNRLQLSKVEVYMKNRDRDGVFVDIKALFKNFIRLFCDNYGVCLNYDMERMIFKNYDYEVTVNGVYVNFMGNVGDKMLSRDESAFISYESNKLQNAILKREIEIEKERSTIKKESNPYNNTMKKNL